MTAPTPVHSSFEPEFVAGLCEIFEQRISFNQLLGIEVTD